MIAEQPLNISISGTLISPRSYHFDITQIIGKIKQPFTKILLTSHTATTTTAGN
jgi:hypothetical protein